MPGTIPAQRSPLEGRIAPANLDSSSDPQSDANAGMGALNSPKVDETGKPTQRAITSAKQAWTIAKKHRDRAVEGRIKKAAQIASKYNGDAPFTPAELTATGQGWRHNFSTNFLASLIDRVTPQLTDPANKADLLTRSVLPDGFDDGDSKSLKFQTTTTKTIRSWKKWKDLLSGLAKEIVLYGNACPMRIDKNWRPRLWGFGEAFLPEGTGQHSTDVQVAVAYQPLLLHEFIKLFNDSTIAKRAGYNVPGCVEVANRTVGSGEAGPKDPTALDQQDVIREGGGAMGWSYENPNRTINLMHILVHDYTGEVDLWTVDADQGTEIRHELGLHTQIEDGITLFTFQSGNRKYYGSKGLGRLEANLHTAIERNRNLGADQAYLSGLILFEGDPKDAAAIESKVRHPFVVVKAGKLIQEQIAFNYEAWDMMDQKLVAIAESIAGAFIPPNLEGGGSSNTKIEAAQKAEREQAVKEGVLGRFFDHLSEMVGMMQRGIYSADNIREGVRLWKDKKEKMETKGIRVIVRRVWDILKKAGVELKLMAPTAKIVAADEDAVNAVVELLDNGLTPEEIVTLSLQPAGANNPDEGAIRDQTTLQMLNANVQLPSPQIDQRAAEEMRWRLSVGEDRAKQLLTKQDDPGVKARASNWQKQEIAQMVDGVTMDVPKDDDHLTHMEVLGPQLGDLVHVLQIAPTLPLIKSAQLMLDHYQGHMQQDRVTPEPAKQQQLGVMKSWQQVIDKATAAMEKRAQEIAAAGGKMGPDGNPIPVQGKPSQVGPNGQIIGEGGAPNPDDPTTVTPDHQIKATSTLAEIEARKRDQDLREQELGIQARKQALEEQKHDHTVTKDALTLQQENVKLIQQHVQHADHIGQSEADREAAALSAPAAPVE